MLADTDIKRCRLNTFETRYYQQVADIEMLGNIIIDK